MKKLVNLSSAAALFGGMMLAIVPSAFAQMKHDAMPMGEMSGASAAYVDAMRKMDMDMGAMMMTGKPGADFAMMMIPHHQSAIDMAKAYLASSDNDPELTQLANGIVAAQESEIAFLKAWLEKNAK